VVVKDQTHAQVTIELADHSPLPAPSPPGEPPDWHDAIYPDREVIIYHGPVYRCLKKIWVDAEGGWGIIEGPQLADFGGRRRPDRWVLCPAVIDACFFACGIHFWVTAEKAVPLPAGIERLQLRRLPKPGERCLLRLSSRGVEKTDQPVMFVRFDFALFGEDRGLILQAKHYRSMMVSERKR
jgi:hypothetical protein